MSLTIYQVDAFVGEGLSGNPAGVCITEQPLARDTMQQLASEVGLSETAFLALDGMQLRWFTPKVEVSLCGHGTLATSQLLLELGHVAAGQRLTFSTLAGALYADVAAPEISLYFPAASLLPSASLDVALLAHIGVTEADIVYSADFGSKLLLVLADEQKLLQLAPDFAGLAALPGRGIVLTAECHQAKFDFVSRYFAPWVGVDEDPVTGSAHCALAVYWCAQLGQRLLHGWQASARGGAVTVELLDNHQVRLIGQARTVAKRQFEVR